MPISGEQIKIHHPLRILEDGSLCIDLDNYDEQLNDIHTQLIDVWKIFDKLLKEPPKNPPSGPPDKPPKPNK